VLCTTGDSFCYHEPAPEFSDISDLLNIYDRPTPKYIGVSDSGLAYFLPWIMQNVGPRTVIIERDLSEVKNSLEKCWGIEISHSRLSDLMSRLRAFKNHPLVMWVPFSSLKEKRVVEKIAFHLMPEVSFDESRYEQLAHMNITVDMKHKSDQVSKHIGNISTLMRAA